MSRSLKKDYVDLSVDSDDDLSNHGNVFSHHDYQKQISSPLHSSSISSSSSSYSPSSHNPVFVTHQRLSNSARISFQNFILFCILFSIVHATVDAVITFATAELGSVLGSYGGFSLYIAYTISSLFIAKPFLRAIGAKHTLLTGLMGNLCYVASFFFSLAWKEVATPVFLIGAIIGGIGSALIWTGQGSYYSLNSDDYSIKSDITIETVLVNFASIFSGTYLGLETLFSAFVTVVYLAMKSKDSWKVVIFGLYSIIAVTMVILFWKLIIPFGIDDFDLSIHESENMKEDNKDEDENENEDENDPNNNNSMYASTKPDMIIEINHPWQQIWEDFLAVTMALWSWRLLQLLSPYQISFGLSSGLINYYVNGFIVKTYIGDGYIGILAAISTITAASCAYPYAYIANHWKVGKWYVIIFSILCFFLNSVAIIIFTNNQLGSWSIMVCYFMIHGAARGAWESTNKAIVAEYFENDRQREIAYACIYFTSGLAGAFGYIFYRYMNGSTIAILNTIVAIISGICYHYSVLLFTTKTVKSTKKIPQQSNLNDSNNSRNDNSIN